MKLDEEFKKKYKPVKHNEKIGIDKYLLYPRDPEHKKVLAKTYEMFVWTLTEDDEVINGKKFHNAKAYITTEVNHYIEDTLIFKLCSKS